MQILGPCAQCGRQGKQGGDRTRGRMNVLCNVSEYVLGYGAPRGFLTMGQTPQSLLVMDMGNLSCRPGGYREGRPCLWIGHRRCIEQGHRMRKPVFTG